MSRLARLTIPGLPHHVTQRGNRRMALFEGAEDYALYRDLMGERCAANGVACWAYCLMPNHVHLILVPSDETGLSRAVGEAHRRYTAFVNARARVTGHLFQGRFGSVVMDEEHLMHAARYLALNPVMAKLVRRARDWPHASVRAHLAGADDPLVIVAPLLARAPRFSDLLRLSGAEEAALKGFEMKGSIGRPLGSAAFMAEIEARTGRSLAPRKRGRRKAGEIG